MCGDACPWYVAREARVAERGIAMPSSREFMIGTGAGGRERSADSPCDTYLVGRNDSLSEATHQIRVENAERRSPPVMSA